MKMREGPVILLGSITTLFLMLVMAGTSSQRSFYQHQPDSSRAIVQVK